MKPKRISLALCTLLAFSLCQAEPPKAEEDSGPLIFRSEDSQGNPVFSDQPSRDAQRVNLKDTNRTPAVQPQAKPPKKQKSASSSYKVIFLEPADGDFFANGLQPVSVSINVSPPVLPKHQIEFLLDGASIALGSNYTTTIERLRPGAHQISARVVDKKGRVVGSPASIEVTAQWPGGR
ncbi:DUF4124 domain-containing protein [Litorivivens sp.]|uniref:DUF4124 domain-containing protein n=2 Tax=Litorivivens sp. TaxID=2020868 RepID=UPI00356448A7